MMNSFQNQPAREAPKQNKQLQNQTGQQSYSGSGIVKTLFQRQFLIIKHPKHFIVFLGVLGLILLVFTIVTLILTLKVVDQQVQYASSGKQCIGTNLESPKCTVKFTLNRDMQSPVYLLYSVKNLYINHRKFVSSYSIDQLNGKVISADIAKQNCGQFVFNKNIAQNKSWTGQPLNPQNIASLCGAKPQGYFNDSFTLYKNGQQVSIDQSNIYKGSAISSHRGPNSESTQWVDPQNQHFKLYMLDGSLLTKRRLWGVINSGLKAGEYELIVDNNYQMAGMKLSKNIFLTTTSIMGGRQFFYPVTFGICTLLCFGFLIFMRIYFRKYEQMKEYDKIYR